MSETIVLITGANQGIGFAIAQKLSTLPSYHLLLGSRTLSKGESAAASLSNPRASALQLDITSDASIDAAVAYVASHFGRLDILVNNAGIMPDSTLGKDGAAPNLRTVLREGFETNVFGTAQVTESFLPLLLKSKDPRIVFMSSGLGSIALTLDSTKPYYGTPFPIYRPSKAAVNMLMAQYAVSLQPHGVLVNACCPGAVSTHMNAYTEGLGTVESGTVAAVRLITEERKGGTEGLQAQTGRFVHKDGEWPW